MAVIKISDKKALDKLHARLILQLGRKITLQETVDLCVQYATDNIKEIIAIASSTPRLTKELAREIIASFEQFKEAYYKKTLNFLEGKIKKFIYLEEGCKDCPFVWACKTKHSFPLEETFFGVSQ